MTRKHFDKELYKKYDTMAKEKVEKIFKGTIWTIAVNEKKMGVDYLVYKDGEHVAYMEVEVKTNWADNEFQYPDVQWPERKWKFCNLDKPTVFLMFSGDLTNYLTATGKTLLGSKMEMIRNKYVPYGENFFKVPVAKVRFNNVHEELRSL